MLAIKGLYDGTVVRPLEPVSAPPNVTVVVVFTEETPRETKGELMELCGCLKDSKAFAGDAVQMQRERRDEWDD